MNVAYLFRINFKLRLLQQLELIDGVEKQVNVPLDLMLANS